MTLELIEHLPILVCSPYTNKYFLEGVMREEDNIGKILETLEDDYAIETLALSDTQYDINDLSDNGAKQRLVEHLEEEKIQVFVELIISEEDIPIQIDTNNGLNLRNNTLKEYLGMGDVVVDNNKIDKPYQLINYVRNKLHIQTLRVTISKKLLEDTSEEYIADKIYKIAMKNEFKIVQN